MSGNLNCWRFTGDFNGDGKTDVCRWDYEDNILYMGLSNGSQVTWSSTTGLSGIDKKNSWIAAGDVNGDGITDIICWNKIGTLGSELWHGISTGAGKITWNKISSTPMQMASGHFKCWRFAGDFNGDGKTDICSWDYEDNILYMGLSNGNQVTWSSITGFTGLNKSYNEIIIDDFDGSGINSIICLNNLGAGNKSIEMWKLNLQKKKNIIKKINSSSGSSVDINYTQISKITGAIDPSDSSYPYISSSSPRQLVTSITARDGRGGSYTKEYSYKNAKFYTGLPHERRDLGFEKITEKDSGTGITQETYYEQKDKWKACNPIYVITKAGNGNLLDMTEYIYYDDTETINTGTHFVKLKEVAGITYEAGTPAFTHRQEFKYDDYGNVIWVKEMSDGTETLQTTIAYDKNETDWILNRPLEITKKSNGTVIDNRIYNYTGNKLSSISQNIDGDITTVSFNSDDCGNIISSTDPLGNTTYMEYDDDYKMFLTKVTNPIGQSVKMEYDNLCMGNVTAKTDQNGNKTENEYDEQGRLIAVINSYGDIISETDYHDELRGNANNQYIETRVYNEDGYQWSKSYYDGLGREYKKRTSSGKIDNNEIIQAEITEYGNSGQISRRTLPYIEGMETPQYINYYYDNAGRIINEERPVNETETVTIRTEYGITNNGLKITKYDPKNGMSTGEYDSRGRLTRKKEPEGAEIKYVYNGLGNLTEVIDSGNNITKIEYDALGRKVRINDPNAGEVRYTYDKTGNLLTKTDSMGNKSTYTYDKLYRLTKIDYTGGTHSVTYKYDESKSSNAKGRLTSADNGISKINYSYDSAGNVEYMKQSIDNTDFIFMMEYDRQRRLTNLTYPDGTKTDRLYADAGYLKAVKSGSGAYVQYGLQLKNGSLDNSVVRLTGNGVESKIKFNRVSLRPLGIESRNRNNDLLEHSEYKYDKLGNITEIKDIIESAKNQTFEYDKLGRITKAKGEYGVENYEYGSTGNLIRNKHGELLYDDPRHPYGVTRDGKGNSYEYDKNGNMTSGRNRDMTYDAEGRLIEIKKSGTKIQKNSYDHTGHRILQERNDGTLIYNISGLYEVVKSINRADHHTKYIYGIDGDLVSQVTRTDAALLSAGNYDGLYGSNKFIAATSKILIGADKYFTNPKNLKRVQYILMIIFLCALAYGVVHVQLRNRKTKIQHTQPIWIKGISIILVTAMFTITGCFFEEEPLIDNENPWTTGDTDGLPTEGTFYFHPDHVGSIKYITNPEGNKVTEVNYTPYGEQTTDGPNIFNKKYTGQTDDNKTELMYYNARYYDPQIGRFITPDSLVPSPTSSQSYNRYMYVNGNPINFRDTGGHWSVKGALKKVVDKVKKVGKDIAYEMSFYGAYKAGGWGGVASRLFTSGIMSYTREGGIGFTFGVQYKCFFFTGFHWQKRGMNGGWSIYGGIGYSNNGFTAGIFASYNLNNGNRTIGFRVGYTFADGVVTTGAVYARTYDRNGNYPGGGFFGYGTVNGGKAMKLATSKEADDGRPQRVDWANLGDEEHKFVVGTENGDMLTGENGPIMKMLDILGLHPHGVFHDNFITEVEPNMDPLNPLGQILCLYASLLIVGRNPDNPYNYQGVWNKY